MIWASVSVGRIAVAGHNDLGSQRLGSGDGCVDVVNLEPEK